VRDLVYYAALEPAEGGGYVVSFPDVYGARTQGDTLAEAVEASQDALVTALGGYIEAREEIPRPRRRKGLTPIPVPPLTAAKLALHEAMREAGMSGRALARRLSVNEAAIRRLLDLGHRSHIGEVEKALAIFGQRLMVGVLPAKTTLARTAA